MEYSESRSGALMMVQVSLEGFVSGLVAKWWDSEYTSKNYKIGH